MIKNEKHRPNAGQNKAIWMSNGKLYFRKDTERMVYFVLTVIMLAAGLLVQLGLL